jgi:N-acetyl-anhydromuramyl-L-alanine amidase AmpD
MHFTAAGSGRATAEYFAKREVSWQEGGVTKTAKVSASSHQVIDRDGTCYQCVAMADTAWHAGPATTWQGKPIRGNANDFTVGIEIANWGELKASPAGGYVNYLGKAFKGQVFTAADGSVWEAYPEPQILAVIGVVKVIVNKYPGIGRGDVLGHEQIQGNKRDPGPAFPWERVLDEVFGDDDIDALNAAVDDDRG